MYNRGLPSPHWTVTESLTRTGLGLRGQNFYLQTFIDLVGKIYLSVVLEFLVINSRRDAKEESGKSKLIGIRTSGKASKRQ